MFLYAHLAIEYLLQQPTKDKLLKKAKGTMLPKKLEQMYVYTVMQLAVDHLGFTNNQCQLRKTLGSCERRAITAWRGRGTLEHG